MLELERGKTVKTIECCQKVVSDGVHLIRLRKNLPQDESGKTLPEYDIKPAFTGNKKRGWFYLDHFTASAVLVCYDALSEENKKKANRVSIHKWASLAFKCVG